MTTMSRRNVFHSSLVVGYDTLKTTIVLYAVM